MLTKKELVAVLRGDVTPDAISLSTPLQHVEWQPITDKGLRLSVKREDLVHPGVSGNKLYKLFFHLQQAFEQNVERLVSFGGAYSNHLHALAIAGNMLGIETLGVIRGEKPQVLSPTLEDCSRMGMQFEFVSRSEYRRRYDKEYLSALQRRFGHCRVIPEGGGGLEGARGCEAISRTILRQANLPVNTICMACGTGTTLAGLISGVASSMQDDESRVNTEDSKVLARKPALVGIPVLKAEASIQQEVSSLLPELMSDNEVAWQLCSDFHAGGYAKLSPELEEFVLTFESATGIPLDPVYTAKLFWGITALAKRGFWPEGSHIVAIHSGGLQGRRGFNHIWNHASDPVGFK